MKTNIILLFVSTLFLSCSEDIIEIPDATYTNTTLEANFFESGTSSIPQIDWNGDEGTFRLAKTIDGVSIDTTTGQLKWTKLLPAGTHSLPVIFENSAGQVAVEFTINNPLQGKFIGTYDTSRSGKRAARGAGNYYEIEFLKNGTINLAANDPQSPDRASGTWTFQNGTIKANYTLIQQEKQNSKKASVAGPQLNFSFQGTVNQHNEFRVRLNGTWYYDFDTETSKARGDFSADIENSQS